MTDETTPTGGKRNDAGALLQLALAGVVLILLGLAAGQARRDPEPEVVEALQDSTGYDFDALPVEPDPPRDTLPFDLPLQPDTALPDTPGFTPGAVP